MIDLLADLANQKTEMEARFDQFIKKTDNYATLQHSARNMRRRIDHFTHLPMGYSFRVRKQKCVDVLSKKGGALKRRVQKTRYNCACFIRTLKSLQNKIHLLLMSLQSTYRKYFGDGGHWSWCSNRSSKAHAQVK